ncbi:MAG: PAS domain S-box protein [Chitinivibrionales bacterium]|nr:PAS domain S-box protein [Chitinivibrionales bacterium]MBD3396112.1 PAS domain S-box protein [Chitinivibrionales bacterium]
MEEFLMATKASDQKKTKKQLIAELARLRGKLARAGGPAAGGGGRDRPAAGAAYERFFENNPDHCYMVSASGNILCANRAARAFLGLKKNEEIGKSMITTVYPRKSRARARDLFALWRTKGKLHNEEITIESAKGVEKTVLLSVDTLKNRKGQVISSISVQRDITERKRAEEELRSVHTKLDAAAQQLAAEEQQLRSANQQLLAHEQQLRSANQQLSAANQQLRAANEDLRIERNRAQQYLDVAGVMMVAMDARGRITLINRRGASILGGAEKSIVGKNWFSTFVPARMRRDVRAVFDALMAGRGEAVEYYENPVVTLRGKERIIAWHNVILRDHQGRAIGTLSSGQDITHRVKAEQDLQESERRFRELVERISDIVYRTDAAGTITYMSPSVKRVFGFAPEEVIGRKMASYYVNPVQREDLLRRLGENGSVQDFEAPIRAKDGSAVWVSTNAHLVTDADGKIVGVEGASRDITLRRRAEQALRDSEERYRTLFETAGDAIALMERDTFVDCNPRMTEVFGCDKKDIVHCRPFDTHLSPQVQPDGRDSKTKALEKIDAALGGEPQFFEWTHLHCDGTPFDAEICLNRVTDGDHPLVLAIVRDISHRKRAEEELSKMQRLESLGLLAGGIAHDFNNLLGGLFGYVDMARVYCDMDEQARKYLEYAMEAFRRAKGLTQQLLTFSKGGAPVKKTASLAPVVKEAAQLAMSGSTVRCMFDIADDLWPAEIDEGQINQVINNMIINARHAMAGGGTIEIRLRNMTAADGDELPVGPGAYVKVEIVDQGTGIPREHLAKIFDPFFTTKQQGSGLGLATSYSIIKKHGGCIEVNSELGRGSNFTILLPASEHDGTVQRAASRGLVRGSGRVLVMDDENIVLEMAGEMLGKLGYTAVCARDGAEAIERYREAMEAGTPFVAVILDLTIPAGMGGKDAVQELLKIDPAVKAIVSSGYADDPVLAQFEKHGFKGVAVKPYRIHDLSSVMAGVLGHSAGR